MSKPFMQENIGLFASACVSLLLLALVILFESTTSMDTRIADIFFNESNQEWLMQPHSGFVAFVFYDGIKILMECLWCIGLIILMKDRRSSARSEYKFGLCVVLTSVLLVTSVIGLLKATSNIACPRDLSLYGGDLDYKRIFNFFYFESLETSVQKCFPAGHAGLGFSFMSIYFLPKKMQHRLIALLVAVSLGWAMGLYKMAIGDHFLSHTLSSMFLAWFIIALIALVFKSQKAWV